MTKSTEKEKILLLLPPSALFKFKLILVLSCGRVVKLQFRDTSIALWGAPLHSSTPLWGPGSSRGVSHPLRADRHTDQGISSIHIPELLCSHWRTSSRRTRIKISISFAQTEMGAEFSRLPEPAAEGSSSSREQIPTHFHYPISQLSGSLGLLWHSTRIHGLGGTDLLLSRAVCSTCSELWNIPFNAPTSSGTFSAIIRIFNVIILIPTISI